MELWAELYPMIEDIQRHVAATGETIVSEDTPGRLIGFSSPFRRWEIRFTMYKETSNNLGGCGHRRAIFRLLQSSKGRTELAQKLSAGAVELLPTVR